jgi:protein TonB
MPPPVPPEPERATAEPPPVETAAAPPVVEAPSLVSPELAIAEPPPVEIAELPPAPALQIIPEPPLPKPPKPRPKFASAPAHVAQPPQSVAEAPAAATAVPTPAPPAAQSLAAVPIIPPQPITGAATNRKPDYPAEALRRRLQGEVLLRVNVSAAGQPEEIAVLTSSGFAMLDAAAIAAVRHWRFHPATQGGLPVAAPASVPIRFRLQD